MENALIIKTSDVELVGKQVPLAYSGSVASHDACLNYGEKLLDQIEKEGMSDELDEKAALFITKSKATVKKINELRSPVTKIFDQFKKVFTTMENEIDVTNKGSLPYQIQEKRNQYAAKKREEEERRRAEELRLKQIEQARTQYRTDCENEYVQWLNAAINDAINHLSEIFSQTTLENYSETENTLRKFPVELAEEWDKCCTSMIRLPLVLPREECKKMRDEVRRTLMEQRLRENYKFVIEDERDVMVAKLPSKKMELEKIAAAEAANAAEAARLKAEIEAKEQEALAAREQKRKEKEEEDRKAAEAAKAASSIGGLFDNSAAASVEVYQPKTVVKKKINVLNAEGFLDILGMWWEHVGKAMTVEQLSKEFSKQMTFCNKMANDSAQPRFIESEHIEYVEDVKAK